MTVAWELQRLDKTGQPKRITTDLILGSAGDCDFIVLHPSISAHHARLKLDEEGLAIYDLGSEQGTFVNERQEDAVLLPHNSGENYIVKFGSTQFSARPVVNQAPPPLPVRGNITGSAPPPLPATASTARRGQNTKYRVKTDSSKIIKKAKIIPEETGQSTDPTKIWYFSHGAATFGPLDPAELFFAVDEGRLTREDKVWKEGMKTPSPAYKVKGLFNIESEQFSSETEKKEEASALKVVGPTMADAGHGSSTCPCCWFKFEPEEVYYISSHPELIGDTVLGQDEQMRFLPDRFTPEGLALDAKGMRCTDMACPRCHMRIPSQILHTTPFFLSIVGAPGSGKSHVLAAAIWRMRNIMPADLGNSFQDVDAVTNQWLNQYEENLFFEQESDRLNPIVKTDETAAHVYRQVSIDGLQIFLPMPCMFTFGPTSEATPSKDCMVLYDNAGENFQVGRDSIHQPGTQHLVRSEGILFLYDPVSDPRMRKYLKSELHVEELPRQAMQRQDTLLVEMIARIRKHAGLTEGVRYENPIIIGLSKADLFGDFFDFNRSLLTKDSETGENLLDVEVLAEVSFQTRSLMKRFAPEVVNSAESFAQKVLFIPVTALGHNPDEGGIKTEHFEPGWVEAPFLYFLTQSGLLSRKEMKPSFEAEDYTLHGKMIRFSSQETGIQHEVPWQYSGYALTCDQTGKTFSVPYVPEAPRL